MSRKRAFLLALSAASILSLSAPNAGFAQNDGLRPAKDWILANGVEAERAEICPRQNVPVRCDFEYGKAMLFASTLDLKFALAKAQVNIGDPDGAKQTLESLPKDTDELKEWIGRLAKQFPK